MKKTGKLIYVLSTIMISSGCSKTISGLIISSADNKPVVEATIILQNYNCLPSIIIKTKTDTNGLFKLNIPWTITRCTKNCFEILINNENFIQSTYTFDNITNFNNNIIKIQPK